MTPWFLNLLSFAVVVLSLILACICASESFLISSRKSLKNVASHFSNKPKQIHISFGATFTDAIIMWSTSNDEAGFVEYGNNPNSLSRAESTRVELKGHSSHLSTKFIHRVELNKLQQASRYTYRVISGGVSGAKSDTFRFDVPHAEPERSHTFMILADMGLATKSLQYVVHEALNNAYEAVFHIGDIAYNLDSQGGSHGDKFMNRIEKMAAQVPYMTTPGDHERFFDFYHYRHRFSSPNASWPMTMEDLWYSFDIGFAHFISLNTESMASDSLFVDKQLSWLQHDLKMANENRHLRPWIIVLAHKPLYCTKSVMEQACDKEKSELRALTEDDFFRHGVDLILTGHKHCYERSWPMYHGHPFQTDYINPAAPIQIIIGALGYEYLSDKQKSQASWLAFAMSNPDKELFGNLTILNSTHLLWSVRNAFNNEEVDFIQVVQHKHGSFGEPGEEALEKIHPDHKLSASVNLPPQPYYIVDEPPSSFFSINRRLILFSSVFSLSLLLFLFVRSSRFRRIVS